MKKIRQQNTEILSSAMTWHETISLSSIDDTQMNRGRRHKQTAITKINIYHRKMADQFKMGQIGNQLPIEVGTTPNGIV